MRGFLVILSAPSGTGKSTICRALLKRAKSLQYSISCTTRQPRAGEKEGKHYFFVGREEFKRLIREDAFLEYAVVHDEYYGTPRKVVEEQLKKGQNVLMAIDVQGAMAIRGKFPDAVLIFVLPPSWRALKGRLTRRKDTADSSFELRLRNAREEVRWAHRFDYIVVNDRLPKALRKIESILTAEGLKAQRLKSVPSLVKP